MPLSLSRRAKLLLAIAAVLLAPPLYLVARALTFEPLPGRASSGRWHGAFHVHSDRSHDGRGSTEELAAAAGEAGLDFVVLTEHNLDGGAPRSIGEVLVVPGVELSIPAGHLLALGHQFPFEEPPRGRAVEQIAARGGFSILSHPVQRRNPWKDWEAAREVDGLELYSGDSLFRAALARPFSRLAPAAFAALVRPEHALAMFAGGELGDPGEARARLLELSASRPRLALCGNDAHGWPSYGASFRSLSLWVPGPPQVANTDGARAQWVLARIADGSAYCAFDPLGDASGFELRGLTGRKAKVGVPLELAVPPDVEVRAYGAAATVEGSRVTPTAPGVLHLEVWRDGPAPWFGAERRPWIVTQPFRVE